jgi:hypothetical protein
MPTIVKQILSILSIIGSAFLLTRHMDSLPKEDKTPKKDRDNVEDGSNDPK